MVQSVEPDAGRLENGELPGRHQWADSGAQAGSPSRKAHVLDEAQEE